MTVYNAQTLTATRICAAERCPNDAETNSRLCAKCAAKDIVVMHTTPKPSSEPMLRCSICNTWKPDNEFTRRNHHHSAYRRYRNAECKTCANTRRRAERARIPRERCQGINHGRPTQRGGEHCRNLARLGTAYCPAHTPKAAS